MNLKSAQNKVKTWKNNVAINTQAGKSTEIPKYNMKRSSREDCTRMGINHHVKNIMAHHQLTSGLLRQNLLSFQTKSPKIQISFKKKKKKLI